jgi:hypothetical protein
MKSRIVLAALLVVATPGTVQAQAAADEDLAKKLANPISSLISVPFQYNFDCCFGASDADRHLLNIQPVVPTKLTPNWNLIIRTILPVIYLESPAPGLDNTFGLSDTLQSFFFSPRNTPGGVTWGVGPAIQWPTGTDPLIDSEKWSAGPTAVILKQQGGWTYGILPIRSGPSPTRAATMIGRRSTRCSSNPSLPIRGGIPPRSR